jgi:hypothetical protein
MIATDRFVFLHLHKSGGTFVNECLLRFVRGARRIGYHMPRMLAPTACAHLPFLGFVRSPWSYYVSWYFFQRQRIAPNALFRTLSDDGRLDFEPTVRNMLELGSGGPLLDRVLAGLPDAYTGRGLNLPSFAFAPIRGTGLGFYSYLEGYVHGEPDGKLHVGRMERMRAELPVMLGAVGQSAGGEMARFISSEPARNVSEHRRYDEYYGTELRDLVAARDGALIARMGYVFGD